MEKAKMKPIKIDDVATLEAALLNVNKTAWAFTIRTAAQIESVVEEVEEILLLALPRSSWTGAQLSYTPAGPSARSYRSQVISTEIVLERRTSGWVCVDMSRSFVYPKSSERLYVALTEEQHMAASMRAVLKLSNDFGVRKKQNAKTAHEKIASMKAAVTKCGMTTHGNVAHAISILYE